MSSKVTQNKMYRRIDKHRSVHVENLTLSLNFEINKQNEQMSSKVTRIKMSRRLFKL
jgi:hypothetical protein